MDINLKILLCEEIPWRMKKKITSTVKKYGPGEVETRQMWCRVGIAKKK